MAVAEVEGSAVGGGGEGHGGSVDVFVGLSIYGLGLPTGTSAFPALDQGQSSGFLHKPALTGFWWM